MVMIAMRKNAIRLVVHMCRVQTNKWPCRILQHHRQAHGSFPESRREYSQFVIGKKTVNRETMEQYQLKVYNEQWNSIQGKVYNEQWNNEQLFLRT